MSDAFGGPVVGIVMGSDSDWPMMEPAALALEEFGVPRPLDRLDGLDSLLSIVQMPAGVPVATVSIGGARNAGLLAARILGAGTDDTARRVAAAMLTFQDDLRAQADAKGERLRALHGDGPGRRLAAALAEFQAGLEQMVLGKHDSLRERTGR